MKDHSPAQEAVKYWETILQGFKPCYFPAFPNRQAPIVQDPIQQTTVDLDISTLPIEEFCSQHHTTVGSLFQTAWAIVVAQYTGEEDVSFGYSVDNRGSSADGRRDGVVICRAQITTQSQILPIMADMMKTLDNSLAHQWFSIAELQKRLGLEGQPLVNCGLRILDSRRTPLVECSDLMEYDILAQVLMNDEGSLAVSICTRTSKFSASQTANVAHTVGKALSECLNANPQSTIGDMNIFSRHDWKQVKGWNAARLEPVDTTFHEHFEAVARRRPDAPAICSWDRNFTYRELDELSTKLASHLLALATPGPRMHVLICFDKSSMAYVSMLGILKAGAAFVGIDPSYPASRIQAIVQATHASIVLADPSHCQLFKGLVEHVVALGPKSAQDLLISRAATQAKFEAGPPSQSFPSDAAYVVFTSGSTGAPKGIVISHRALCTASLALASPMRVGPTTRFLQFAAYTFDLSYGDIFVTLSQGGCICVPSEHERINDLASAIRRMAVDTACLIPSVARILRPADIPTLKTLLLGGEALSQESLDQWAGRDGIALVQMYGPSEATIWCTSEEMKADSAVSNIGRGLPGAARLWIASPASHDRLMPIGCVGELLVEGPVLATGYLDAGQTARAFVEDPAWAEVVDATEPLRERRRFYKTGDLARQNADGTVTFVGRKDTQVKLHGRRIEVGEIEYHLSSHGLLRQSMVTVAAAGVYAQRLVAIVVLKTSTPTLSSEKAVSELKAVTGRAKEASSSAVAQLRDFLSSRVPHYMVPQFWVVVEDIPVMVSGKMNRVVAKRFVECLTEAMSGPEGQPVDRRHDHHHTAPYHLDNPVEIRLRNVWSHVLGKDVADIGVEQSFASLGGDSFAAMELVAGCKAEGITLVVQDVFSGSTIRQMASIATSRTGPTARVVRKFAPIWWD
ncbi:hypothetical protein V8C42DRAFT_349296 [Trichoderma barbatum]